jgi:MFS family permease
LFIGSVVSVISSLGAPLIPAIAEDLGTTVGSAQWSLTVTLVVGAVATPIVGRVGDGRWRREVLLVCLGAVTVGGALAALAHTLSVLVAGRAMQGLGLALLPLTMATARDSLTRDRVASAIVSLSVIGAAGVGLGYPLTGLLADISGTAAAFWFGVVTSGAALTVAAVVVPSTRQLSKQPAIDAVGAVLVAVGLVGLLIALQNGMRWGWGSPQTLSTLAAAVVVLVLWGRHELRVRHPLVDLRLFATPQS